MRISDWSSDVCSSDLDRVHVDFGMPMGPFQMSDLAGVDIGWHRDPMRIESIRDALAAEKRWGQKTKAGFYAYDDKRNPSPSPRVAEIIEDFRKQNGDRKGVVEGTSGSGCEDPGERRILKKEIAEESADTKRTI